MISICIHLSLAGASVVPGVAEAGQRSGGSDWPDLAAPADVEETGRNDVALIVAIGDYAFLPGIPGARMSGWEWSVFLESLGMRQENVVLLEDSDCTRERIVEEAERLVERTSRRGRFWFLYIGHGAPAADGRDGLLVGVDAAPDPASLQQRSITREEILELLDRGKQSHTLVVFDTAFTGLTARGWRLVPGLQPLVPANDLEVRERTTILSAAGAGESTGQLPGRSRSAFSYLVLGGLRGWADADGDSRVTAEEVHGYATTALRITARDRDQTPQLLQPRTGTVLTHATEKGPDLDAITAARWSTATGPTEGSSDHPRDVDPKNGTPESPERLAELAREREARAAALRRDDDRLRRLQARRKAFDDASRFFLEAARDDWGAMEGQLRQGGPEALAAVDLFLETYSNLTVAVAGEVQPVEIPELELGRRWLETGVFEAPAVERFPSMSAPPVIEHRTPFRLVVGLTEDPRAPVVAPGEEETAEAIADGAVAVHAGETTREGALALDLPATGEDGWDIAVVLDAAGFDIIGGDNEETIRLTKEGGAVPATFRLQLVSREMERPRVAAYLFHGDRLLARIGRAFLVGEPASPQGPLSERDAPAVFQGPVGQPTEQAHQASGPVAAAPPPLDLDARRTEADLQLFVIHEDYLAQDTAMVILLPRGRGRTKHVVRVRGDERKRWLDTHLRKVASASRGARPADPDRRPGTAALTLEAMGDQLWERFTPEPVRDAIWSCVDRLGDDCRTLQIYTDDPGFPWELVRPARRLADGTTEELGFLGIRFQVARWHLTEREQPGLPLPPQVVAVPELLAIAPSYEGGQQLAAQSAEIEVLSGLPGFRRVGGDLDTVIEACTALPPCILHFAGHGTLIEEEDAVPRYAVQLEDGEVEAMEFGTILAPQRGAHPFVFFNACDVGHANEVAGFVDGWAPTFLEAGASGYLGTLWPIADQGAALFATRFYTELNTRMDETGSANVTDVLRTVRREFHEHGDATFLAYIYYGDPNTNLVRQHGED